MSDLLKAPNDLTAALEAKPDPTYGGLLDIKDQMPLANTFLTPLAKDFLGRECRNQIIQTSDETYVCAYVAKMGKETNIPENVEKIALVVNRLVDHGLIYKTLTPIKSMNLCIQSKFHVPSAVYCFVLTPVSRQDEVKAICGDLLLDESGFTGLGRTPKLYKELPPGQFYAANVQESLSASIIGQYENRKSTFLERTIDQYLAVLPEGTTVVSTKACDIVSLSKPYEIIFFNENLPSIKEVELHYIRHAEQIGGPVDGHIKQTTLLSGVTYTLRDGTKLGS